MHPSLLIIAASAGLALPLATAAKCSLPGLVKLPIAQIQVSIEQQTRTANPYMKVNTKELPASRIDSPRNSCTFRQFYYGDTEPTITAPPYIRESSACLILREKLHKSDFEFVALLDKSDSMVEKQSKLKIQIFQSNSTIMFSKVWKEQLDNLRQTQLRNKNLQRKLLTKDRKIHSQLRHLNCTKNELQLPHQPAVRTLY